jgi:hypothetical protein
VTNVSCAKYAGQARFQWKRLSIRGHVVRSRQPASRNGLQRDDISGAEESWNLTNELARLDLIELSALSNNFLHRLKQALKNDEKPRFFVFAYEPLSGFNANIRRLLCESLAFGFV